MTALVVTLALGLVVAATALGRRAEPVTLPDPPVRLPAHLGATVDWSPKAETAAVPPPADREFADWEIKAVFDAIVADLTATPDWLAEFQRGTDLLNASITCREAPDLRRAAWAAAGLGPDTAEYPIVPTVKGRGR